MIYGIALLTIAPLLAFWSLRRPYHDEIERDMARRAERNERDVERFAQALQDLQDQSECRICEEWRRDSVRSAT